MTIGDRIQKLGFKRWYERTLIEGHVYLVTAILGMTLALAGMELVGERDGNTHVLFGFVAAASGAFIMFFCGWRYLRALMLAQQLGEHATCPRCGTYASFNVLSSSRAPPDDLANIASLWVRVKCRKCGNEWGIWRSS